MSADLVTMHLTPWYIVFVCHQNDVCENYIGSVYVVGIVVSDHLY